jgi:hypothetical protein
MVGNHKKYINQTFQGGAAERGISLAGIKLVIDQ